MRLVSHGLNGPLDVRAYDPKKEEEEELLLLYLYSPYVVCTVHCTVVHSSLRCLQYVWYVASPRCMD